MTYRLKPCPFCGQKQEDEKWSFSINPLYVDFVADVYGEIFYVQCYECNASGSEAFTKEDAIKAWNTRADKE